MTVRLTSRGAFDAHVVAVGAVDGQRAIECGGRIVVPLQPQQRIASMLVGFSEQGILFRQLQAEQVVERLQRLFERACLEGSPAGG